MIQRPENDGLLVKIDFMCFYLREKMSKKYKAWVKEARRNQADSVCQQNILNPLAVIIGTEFIIIL